MVNDRTHDWTHPTRKHTPARPPVTGKPVQGNIVDKTKSLYARQGLPKRVPSPREEKEKIIENHRKFYDGEQKPVLTHRQLRAAKKRFKKRTQCPRGWSLLYSMNTSISANPPLSQKLIHEWAQLDFMAQKMYHRQYDVLNKFDKAKVLAAMSVRKGDEESSIH